MIKTLILVEATNKEETLNALRDVIKEIDSTEGVSIYMQTDVSSLRRGESNSSYTIDMDEK